MGKIDFTLEEKKIWTKNPYCIHCQLIIKVKEVNDRNIQIHDANNLAHKDCPEE